MNGVWKKARSVAYTMSNNPRIVTGMPIAGPLTAAISGLGKSIKAATNLLQKQTKSIIKQ